MANISKLSKTAKKIYESEDSDSNRALVSAARIRAMDFSTALPVLMVLLDNPNIAPEDAIASAVWLESYLVRRTVLGLNTGMYGLFFVDVMNIVESGGRASDAIAAMLMKQTSDSTRWPSDEEFGDGWKANPLHKTLKRSRLTMILRALEGSMRNPDLADPVSIPTTLHIEHIMPQSWEQWWPPPPNASSIGSTSRDRLIHTIGNLTLLREKLNGKMSNNPWTAATGQDSKRAASRQHGLMRLNVDLGAFEHWDEDTIVERSNLLLKHAIKIWARPAQ